MTLNSNGNIMNDTYNIFLSDKSLLKVEFEELLTERDILMDERDGLLQEMELRLQKSNDVAEAHKKEVKELKALCEA
jgi:hypothetical protein